MGTAAEMLRPSEAAVVAAVALRDVNRAIDEHILPANFVSLEDGRRIAVTACTLVAFYFASTRHLTSEGRRFAIQEIGNRLQEFRQVSLASLVAKDWTVRGEFLTIDLAPFVRRTSERMKRLTAARAMVVSDLDVLGGAPVIDGTRVPVHDVAASVLAGLEMERILAAYPSLDADKVELAAIYAEANPPRGRPKASEGLEGAVVLVDRRVPRRTVG